MDIVERLKFDAARCEAQFSKGVAGNMSEAADVIERLTAALEDAVETLEAMDLHTNNPLYDRLRLILEQDTDQ